MKIKMALFEFLIPILLVVGALVIANCLWLKDLPTISPEDLPTKPRVFVSENKRVVLSEKAMQTEAVRTIANFVWKYRNSDQYHLTVVIDWKGEEIIVDSFLVDYEKLELAKGFITMEKHRCNSHVKAVYAEIIEKIDRHNWLSDPQALEETFGDCNHNTD